MIAHRLLISTLTTAALSISGSFGFTGDMTFYDTVGSAGACGNMLTNDMFIVALNTPQYYEQGGHCLQTLCITYNGKQASAVVQDQCPGCSYGSLDASPALFNYFNDPGVGRFQMSWQWGACGSPPQTTTAAPSPPPPPPPPPSTTSQIVVPQPTTTQTPPPPTTQAPQPSPPPQTTDTPTPTTSQEQQQQQQPSTSVSSSNTIFPTLNVNGTASMSLNSTATFTGTETTISPTETTTTTTHRKVPLNATVTWPSVLNPATYVPLSLRTQCLARYRSTTSVAVVASPTS
ncbi:hypothetical protein HDU76_010148 [Blyttiomyces sp. JEL0837]|nr:hypothetical protein HDU76_010148 [Blyttiomyces sp. JEL0837]